MNAANSADHARLMDSVYRGQRHIYDFTRKYYLFGRDRLIAGLACAPGSSVLEVACGTGRNLALIGTAWPGVQRHGLDISAEMLASARARLPGDVALAQGDACAFDPAGLFGLARFDRIVLSYALSMIPDWDGALDQAARILAPGGALHVVDFGDLAGMPPLAAGALRRWLARFHVAPRDGLRAAALVIAARYGLACEHVRGPLGYYQMAVLRRA